MLVLGMMARKAAIRPLSAVGLPCPTDPLPSADHGAAPAASSFPSVFLAAENEWNAPAGPPSAAAAAPSAAAWPAAAEAGLDARLPSWKGWLMLPLLALQLLTQLPVPALAPSPAAGRTLPLPLEASPGDGGPCAACALRGLSPALRISPAAFLVESLKSVSTWALREGAAAALAASPAGAAAQSPTG